MTALSLVPITPKIDLTRYTNQQGQEDENARQFALKFLSKADFIISDIRFIEFEHKVDQGNFGFYHKTYDICNIFVSSTK
jgi:hypothetical protein